MNMKYWLFDLAITLSIAAAIISAHRSFGSFFENVREADGHCANHEDQTAATPKPEPTTFHVGDIVEVYEPKIHPSYAFLAEIEHISPNPDDGGPVQYDVRFGFGGATGGAIHEKIQASAIRRMEPFEEKTPAMCDDGKTLNSKLILCTVDFHIPNSMRIFERGAQQQEHQYPWLYSVSFQQDGEWRKKIMPVSRIRRIVRQDTSGGGSKKCDEPSCGNFSSPRSRSTQENLQVKNPTTTPVVSNKEKDSSTFPIGSVIEIHGPGGIFALPATVTGVNDENKAKKYHLTHGITHASMKNVDVQFVHPYRVYPKGTTASCNVGKLRKIIMVPCTVISNVEDNDWGGGIIVYQVEAKMLDDEEQIMFLPRMRVQRFFEDRGGQKASDDEHMVSI